MRRTPVGLRCRDCAAPTQPRRRGARRWRAAALVVGLAAIGVVGGLVVVDPSADSSASQPPDVVVTEATTNAAQEVVDDLARRVPGGTVAWVDTGGERLTVAAGQADRRSDQPLSGDEAFLIGDVAHMISATVGLQLVEEGRLELDQPIAQITPELAGRFEHGNDVTVRHLLGHTSGLADYATSQFALDFTDLSAPCRHRLWNHARHGVVEAAAADRAIPRNGRPCVY